MAIVNDSCTYCGKPFDAESGEGDYIMPAALGKFRGDQRFRLICTRCNNHIGRSEQQLLQCAPEAFYRSIVNPPNRRGRKGQRSLVGALGMPPPKHTVRSGDHDELVEIQQSATMQVGPVDQLVVRDDTGADHHIRLFPGMNPDQLRERLTRAGVKDFSKAWFHCDEKTTNEFQALLQATWPHLTLEVLPSAEPGTYQRPGRVKFTTGDDYFRALAKIAFHYYLVHTHRGFRGNEPEFKPLREFIMKGGDPTRFFRRTGSTFKVPFGELRAGGAITPVDWCHVLAADESRDVAVVCIRLFAGPRSVRPPQYVALGSLNSRIRVPSAVWAHAYIYDRIQPPSGYAGHVEEARIMRLR